jgi:hypothetical protein
MPVRSDLITRARAGDGDAFRELTEPHRRELQVHCYRMLGSFADAEDALQDTLLAAWQGIGGYAEERASLRTWLYRIATNRCLNALRAASRRPACSARPSSRSPAPSSGPGRACSGGATRPGAPNRRPPVSAPASSALAAGSILCPRANGQPAFGAYLRAPAGLRHGTGLYVLTLAGGQIRAMTRFETGVLPWFGLPRSLPSRG